MSSAASATSRPKPARASAASAFIRTARAASTAKVPRKQVYAKALELGRG